MIGSGPACQTGWDPTCQDAAGDPRNALDLRHVVVDKEVITGGVQEGRVTEYAPQLGGDGTVVFLDDLGTHVEALGDQCSISQHTDAVKHSRHSITAPRFQ